MAAIELIEVTKDFGAGQRAVDAVTLSIPDGGLTALLGPSGCGKTTLLRMVAGLETVTSGQILLDGTDITHVPPEERDIAMVFQNYALYPHMTVAGNLGFSLKMAGVPKAERASQVAATAKILELTELLHRKPGQLSGGQQQRVAMGRAIVRNPRAFLMDEPLSNLDERLRTALRIELAKLQETLGVTTIYVTHDRTEAMTLGDHVAVMSEGVLQQAGSPRALFDAPSNAFVASFLGSPGMNLARGIVTGDAVRLGGWSLGSVAPGTIPDGDIVVGVRPTAITVAGEASDRSTVGLPGTLDSIEDLGAEVRVGVLVDAPPVDIGEGDVSALSLVNEEKCRFLANMAPTQVFSRGDRVRLDIPPDAVYLFDTETGRHVDQQVYRA